MSKNEKFLLLKKVQKLKHKFQVIVDKNNKITKRKGGSRSIKRAEFPERLADEQYAIYATLSIPLVRN